jgi:hypothetical protein
MALQVLLSHGTPIRGRHSIVCSRNSGAHLRVAHPVGARSTVVSQSLRLSRDDFAAVNPQHDHPEACAQMDGIGEHRSQSPSGSQLTQPAARPRGPQQRCMHVPLPHIEFRLHFLPSDSRPPDSEAASGSTSRAGAAPPKSAPTRISRVLGGGASAAAAVSAPCRDNCKKPVVRFVKTMQTGTSKQCRRYAGGEPRCTFCISVEFVISPFKVASFCGASSC